MLTGRPVGLLTQSCTNNFITTVCSLWRWLLFVNYDDYEVAGRCTHLPSADSRQGRNSTSATISLVLINFYFCKNTQNA